MSKIDELIKELCPDGVKWKHLGDICVSLMKGTLKRGQLVDDGAYPVINSGREWYGFYDSYNNEADALIIAARGEYAGFVSYISTKFWAGGLCYPYRSIKDDVIQTKFIYYYLKNNEQSIMDTLVARGSIPAINKSDVDKIQIPLPPLPIQEEIVRILDKFTKLEAELEAELEARKKQYEYYRNQLLSPIEKDGKWYMNGHEVEWKTLGDIAHYPKKRISFSSVDENSYVGVDNLLQNRQGKTLSSYVPCTGSLIAFRAMDILIGNIRPYLKKIWLSNITGGTNGDVVVVRINSTYDAKYIPPLLYHVLASDAFFEYNMRYAKGAKMPRGDKEAIFKYSIPIPPLSEQERIVSILDRFDALVNDISIGLPAEIEARRKQYEYYRGKLLSFKNIADKQEV